MKVLLAIDLQNDFLPGGSLEVPHSNSVIDIVNKVQEQFSLVVASQDWHPQDHVSFASNHEGKNVFEQIPYKGQMQTLWPDHCVQNTKGADFHIDLNTEKWETIFRKGTDPSMDSYSMFYDNGKEKSTGLKGYLEEKGAKTLYFTGLAADICVYYSAKDALSFGFECIMIEDGMKALDEEAYAKQKEELMELGVKYIQSSDL